MKRRCRSLPFLLACALMFFVSVPAVLAQSSDSDFEATLKQLAETAGKAYVKPVTDGFGANFNGGWYHKAPAAKLFGIDIEVGIVAMGSFLPDADLTFSTSGAYRFTTQQAQDLVTEAGVPAGQLFDDAVDQVLSQDFTVSFSGPTVIGSENENVVVGFSGSSINVGGTNVTLPSQDFVLQGVNGVLNDVSIIPFAAPQLSVGTFLGTVFTFRYVPDIEIDKEIGTFKYFGFGIQHNLQSWINYQLPVDVSLGFFTQTLDIGTIIEATGTAYGINASKQLGGGLLNLTPYAGFMLESSTMDFSYDYDVDTPTGTTTENITFSLEGANNSRLTLGLAMKLLLVNLHADYNIGKINSISAGVFFGF